MHPMSIQYWQRPTVSLVCFFHYIFVPSINIENSIRAALLARVKPLHSMALTGIFSFSETSQQRYTVEVLYRFQIITGYFIYLAFKNYLKQFYKRFLIICSEWKKFCTKTGIICLRKNCCIYELVIST